MSFQIHPRLLRGSFLLGERGGCSLLLKDNALFPWLMIVPVAPEGVEDLHQLEEGRCAEVMAVVRAASCFVSDYFAPEKLNVACIGNQVRQMHLHVVGRSPEDAAWPGVVWGSTAKEGYHSDRVREIQAAFAEHYPV